MNRYQIQHQMSEQWSGTGDVTPALFALECARTGGDPATIARQWRWLANELMVLYHERENEAAACLNWCQGYIDGATRILNRWLSAAIK